jgi:hypothetical protein
MTKESNDEMKEIATGFPHIERPDPPDNYFEEFPDRMLNRWRQKESYPVRRKINMKFIAAVAAVLVFAVLSIWFISHQRQEIQQPSYTSAEAYQYVQENIDEFENLIETSEVTISEITETIPAAEIEEYLLEELDKAEPEDLF